MIDIKKTELEAGGYELVITGVDKDKKLSGALQLEVVVKDGILQVNYKGKTKMGYTLAPIKDGE